MRLAAYVGLLALAACSHQNRADRPRPVNNTIITAEDIDRSPGLSLEQLLITRIPGLTLTHAPDGHTVIHIRGTTTVLGDQEPLFVLNGIPLDNPITGALTALSPRDIEYIQVLRDATSTAAYGSRGANGVIVIKTKQS
ncbi:MAG: hypothetical protein DMD48_02900 [Gemmatimonadetes bacterium]|nr:MAG: hypothetical protein DMD48_02900 [Gemmatimonadota bacterium]